MKKEVFYTLCSRIFDYLNSDEQLTLFLEGENSQYFRFNDSKLRQSGIIEDFNLTLSLYNKNKCLQSITTISADLDSSVRKIIQEIDVLRSSLNATPPSDNIVFPDKFGSVEVNALGNLPERENILDSLMGIIDKNTLTGVWSSGKIFRGCCASNGTKHWFEKDSFLFDFSLIDRNENMVKILYPHSNWNESEFRKIFRDASSQLSLMDKSRMELKPGKYRTWFEPCAVADFIDMFSWNGVSESSIRKGSSCFIKMRNEKKKLSPLFSLDESFTDLTTSSFNTRGEVSSTVSIIKNGVFENALINSKTANEYNLESNYAEDENSWGMGEYFRSPSMHGGSLHDDDKLKALDTGLFMSNIHYLNWSDNLGGRITGLTRYVCYWVENGEMIAPIKTMRFDDSFYNFLGDNLEAVGEKVLARPVIDTYDGRNPGETNCPGILVNDFELTL